jgi:calcium binding protein 39
MAAFLLSRLSLRTPTTKKPAAVVATCRKAADILMAVTTAPAPTKAIETLEKALDDLHLLTFEIPYSPKGDDAPSTSYTSSTSPPSSASPPSSVSSSSTASTASTASPTSPIAHTIVSLVVQEEIDLFLSLVMILRHLHFEHRKLVAILFKHYYRCEAMFRDYVIAKVPLLDFLVTGYQKEQREICINLHSMLHCCVKKDKRIVEWLLNSTHLPFLFTNYCVSEDFDVQSKSFTVFAAALKLYPKTSATYVKQNMELFFDMYNLSLINGNYIVQIQYLKLLSEMLVVRKWRKVMAMYVNRKENLMPIMKLLRSKSTNIQYETFHVFKIFVANPNKDERVDYVFKSNIKKLIKFMKKFLNEKCNEDDDLLDERDTVVETLKAMAVEEKKEEVKIEEQQEAESEIPLPLPLPLPKN